MLKIQITRSQLKMLIWFGTPFYGILIMATAPVEDGEMTPMGIIGLAIFVLWSAALMIKICLVTWRFLRNTGMPSPRVSLKLWQAQMKAADIQYEREKKVVKQLEQMIRTENANRRVVRCFGCGTIPEPAFLKASGVFCAMCFDTPIPDEILEAAWLTYGLFGSGEGAP